MLFRSYEMNTGNIRQMINYEAPLTGSSGFVSDISGTYDVIPDLPGHLLVSWTMQARLAGAIAEMFKFDTMTPLVQTKTLLAVIGKSKNLLANMEIYREPNINHYDDILLKYQINNIELDDINKCIIEELFKKSSMRVSSDKVNGLPIIGSVIGSSIGGIQDSVSTVYTGDNAINIFADSEYKKMLYKDDKKESDSENESDSEQESALSIIGGVVSDTAVAVSNVINVINFRNNDTEIGRAHV